MRLKSLLSLPVFLLVNFLLSTSAPAQGSSGQPFQDLQNQIDSLQQQLDSLADGAPVSLDVDCDAGDSVVGALNSASPLVPLTVTISGLCNEAVFIVRDDVTLEGASPSDGINGIIASIGGTSRISLNGLTINAATSPFGAGLACFQGSVVNASGLTINGGARGVWAIDGGKCRLVNSVIDGSSTGVEARRHSLADLESVTIRNANTGIDTFLGGSITLQSGSSVEQNNVGVMIRNGSTAEIINSRIINNTGDGLVVSQGSSILVTRAGSGTVTISGNGGDGIQLSGLSTASVFLQPDSVTGNDNFDLACLGQTSPIYLTGVFDSVDPNCP